MGFYVTGSECERREKTHPPSKNRVWDFLATSQTCAGQNVRFAQYPRPENEPTPTTTASGARYYGYRFYCPNLGRWINKDPIEEEAEININGFCINDSLNYVDLDGQQRGPPYHPRGRRKPKPETPYIPFPQPKEGTPNFPKSGYWMCQEELVGRWVWGPNHHRFIVVDGVGIGYEKQSEDKWGGPGGTRFEADEPLHRKVSCYELTCLKKECAAAILEKMIILANGTKYRLAYRDCQSWANTFAHRAYKECEDPCCKDKKPNRPDWKRMGW